MKIQFFTQRKTLLALPLLITALSSIAMVKEEPLSSLMAGVTGKVYSITNHTDQPLRVRLRVNDTVYRPYAAKYDYDILGNSEVLKLNSNQALFIPQADIKFPLNIRIWPGTYVPKAALNEQGKNLPTPSEDTENSIALIQAGDFPALNAQAGPNGDIELIKGSILNRLVVRATSATPFYETSKNVPVLSNLPVKQPILKPIQIVTEIPAITRVLIKPDIMPAAPDIPKISAPSAQYVPYIPNISEMNEIVQQEAKQLTEQNGYLIENIQPSEFTGYFGGPMKQNNSRYTLIRNSFGPLYARIELGKYVFKPLNFTWDHNHNVFLFEKVKDLLFDSRLLNKYGTFNIYLWLKENLDLIRKNVDTTKKPIPTTAEDEIHAVGVQKANNMAQLRGKYNAYDLVNDHGNLLINEINIK